MRTLFYFLFWLVALVPASSLAEGVSPIAAAKGFQDADLDSDGGIDAAEFETYFVKIYPSLDLNDDGILTFDECLQGNFSARPGDDQAAPSGQVSYRFDSIDADGSKGIDPEEYVAYARDRFPYYDTSGDGAIDSAEFEVFYRESLPCQFNASTLSQPE